MASAETVVKGVAAFGPEAGKAFKATGEAIESTYDAYKAGEKAGASIAKNAAKGKAFESQVAKELEKTDESIASQVTLKTRSGNKTRMDFLSLDKKTGKINVTEAKSSKTAPLTRNQAQAHPEIGTSGATVAGKGKPGFPGGTQIPPTQVNIVRP
ncbi:MAG TPA: hypothetical protein VHY30_00425 [Verrucomicrobiae bacterium]|nr:hypothetical protein [Verrucomicrobiae bacterium]